MLYLEDYLELIEHLPQELRDRFTDIRERDLQVHNSSEQLKEKVKNFFAEAKKLKPEQRECEYQRLLDSYEETEKYADDKVHIASQMHEIMLKLVQRLDSELEKFKLELEADHAGITEELERRSLELDTCDTSFDFINSHLNGNNNSTTTSRNVTPVTSKQPSGIKDRRRSEHKQHRHHPYKNNQTNGYHGRAKLSNQEHVNSVHDNNHQHQNRQNFKMSHGSSCRQQTATTSSPCPSLNNKSLSSPSSAPASVSGDLNEQLNLLSPFVNDSNFRGSSNKQQLNTSFKQQHSALSAALASNSNPKTSLPNGLNASSNQNKISTSYSKINDLAGINSSLGQNHLGTQAIVANQQQLHLGRRTPSLKSINADSMDSLTGNKQDTLSGTNRNALAPMAPDQQALRYNHFGKPNGKSNGSSSPLYISVTKSGRATKRPKHHASHLFPDESPTSISSDNSVFENSESMSSADFIETGTAFGSSSPSSLDFASNNTQSNTTLYHRDETKYCICRQISYGEMVACDNDGCEIEWFHYECVGITQPPKGKWFCPDCHRKMNGHQQNHNNHNSQPQTLKKRGRKEKSLFNVVNNSSEPIKSCDRSKD